MDFDIKHVEELAIAAAPLDVLNRSIGVDENCFSPERIVSLVRKGATGEDYVHLLSCPTCMEQVVLSVQIISKLNPSRLAQHERKSPVRWFQGLAQVMQHEHEPVKWLHSFFPLTRQEQEPWPVILGLDRKILYVKDPSHNQLPLTCAIFPTVDREMWKDIVPGSLRLDGAVVAKRGTLEDQIDITADGKIDCVKISFADGKLTRRILSGLNNDQRVTDTIQIHGHFTGRREFFGQANVEFISSATAAKLGL